MKNVIQRNEVAKKLASNYGYGAADNEAQKLQEPSYFFNEQLNANKAPTFELDAVHTKTTSVAAAEG